MFGWLRKRPSGVAIPDPLGARLLSDYPFLGRRAPGELERLRELAARFLRAKEFHGANGFTITDEVALAIAAQAVLPVLNLGLHWYDDFVGIVVHPDEVVARRTLEDEHGVVHLYDEVLAGETMEGGPVMVNWRDVQASGDTAATGYNVVVHEFIHKIDLRDGLADGCPPLPSREARERWLALMASEHQAFREKVLIAQRFGGATPWLDDYAATSVDEFFAVACEGYFVNRERFSTEFPMLTLQFDGFFGPAPAAGRTRV